MNCELRQERLYVLLFEQSVQKSDSLNQFVKFLLCHIVAERESERGRRCVALQRHDKR